MHKNAENNEYTERYEARGASPIRGCRCLAATVFADGAGHLSGPNGGPNKAKQPVRSDMTSRHKNSKSTHSAPR